MAMAFVQNRVQKILAAHGLAPLEKDKWYPMVRLLDATQTIRVEIGPNTLKAVGRKIPESAEFPPSISSIKEAYPSIDVAYRMNHRGTGSIGGYRYEAVGERSGRMTCDNPYPCEFDEGLLEATGERYRPQDSLWVRVEHQPGRCRKKGDSYCSYFITW